MSSPDIEPPPATTNDVSHASDVRAAARWLMGASASVVAVLVAGLQLRDFTDIGQVGPGALLLAILAALISLASVAWTLYSAAAVLAAPRRSIDELATLDRADNGNFPKIRLDSPASPLMNHLVVDRRIDLLGRSRQAIWQLTSDRAKVHKALTRPPSEGGNVKIGTSSYKLDDPSDKAALVALAHDLDRRAQLIVDAAMSFETRVRYNRLVKGMKLSGGLFVLSLSGLIFLQSLAPTPMKATSPTNVRVFPAVSNDSCDGKTLEGVAVGGTMDAPVVVLPSQAGCPAKKLTDTEGLVVVPQTAK